MSTRPTPTIHRHYYLTDHGHVHYRATAPAGGSPLLLLHQTASTSAMFEPLMAELGDDFACLAPDTPGYGASDLLPDDPTIVAYAAVVADLLAALGVAPCIVFGHHTGAAIAVALAAGYPGRVRGLVLCGPPYLTAAQKAELPGWVSPIVPDDDGAHLAPVWQRLRGRAQGAAIAVTTREFLSTLAAADHYRQTYTAVAAYDFEAQLAALDQPVIVMAGEHDTLRHCLEPALAAAKHGRGDVVPGAGVYLCDTHPTVVANTIRSLQVA